MPRIASLSPHEPRGCTLRVTLTALLRLRLKSRQIRADSGRSYEGCRKSEKFSVTKGRCAISGPFCFGPDRLPGHMHFRIWHLSLKCFISGQIIKAISTLVPKREVITRRTNGESQ